MSSRWIQILRATLCAILFLSPVLAAGEKLISEDFEKLDLNALPAGWKVTSPDEVSIVDESGSKVLKIAHKGGGMAELLIPLNIDAVRGRTIRISTRIKCPKGYTFVREKQGAPQVMTSVYVGGSRQGRFAIPPPTAKNWLNANSDFKIPEKATAVTIGLRVKHIACEVFFDNLMVTAEGVRVGGGGKANPITGKPTTPGTQAGAPHSGLARRTVEEHGARVGPQIAGTMRALRRKGANPNTYVVLGPAAPLKELKGSLPAPWKCIAAPRELTGPAATPAVLFLKMPEFLNTKKPEMVLIACSHVKDRKASYKVQHDWDDLARLCLRFGAIPILVIPPGKAECATRMDMLEAARRSNLPAVEVSPADGGERLSIAKGPVPLPFPNRVTWIFRVLEQHVCDRKPSAAPTQGSDPEEDEEE